jgi:acetyltransferase
MGEQDVAVGRQILERGKIPYYRYPESAVDVFLKMCDYSRNLQLLHETPTETPKEFLPQTEAALNIIQTTLQAGRTRLNEHDAKALLHCYDIPITINEITRTPAEAVAFAEAIGYPVVLKIVSQDIIHKSDIGGVAINLHSPTAVKNAFADIIKRVEKNIPKDRIEGILIERMAAKGYELLIGAHKDPVFGPVVAFGQGGVAVEVLKDMQLGLPPLNMALARQIIEGTRIYQLLKGYREVAAVDLEQLAFTLVKFSYLLMDFPEICEVDINPFISNEHGGIVVDAHVELNPQDVPRRRHDYHHLVVSPYPGKYTRQVQLKDGSDAVLRPIRPEDEPLVARMFQNLSKESLYYRFFGYVPQVTHEFLTRYTQIDYDREIAIIAEIDDESERKMIGVVRIIADAWGDSAEYAILIADPWQRQGLGYLLTDFILDIARARGIRKIYASVLATNSGMIHIFEKRGFTVKRDGFDAYYVELEL